jgi:large subunit ribosomal protein L29
MRIREIRDMTDAEISTAIENAREEMFNLRVQREVGTLENYARIKELKCDLARMLTVLRERELAAQMVFGQLSKEEG